MERQIDRQIDRCLPQCWSVGLCKLILTINRQTNSIIIYLHTSTSGSLANFSDISKDCDGSSDSADFTSTELNSTASVVFA